MLLQPQSSLTVAPVNQLISLCSLKTKPIAIPCLSKNSHELEVKIVQLEVVGVVVDELFSWDDVVSHKHREDPAQIERSKPTPGKLTTERAEGKIGSKWIHDRADTETFG